MNAVCVCAVRVYLKAAQTVTRCTRWKCVSTSSLLWWQVSSTTLLVILEFPWNFKKKNNNTESIDESWTQDQQLQLGHVVLFIVTGWHAVTHVCQRTYIISRLNVNVCYTQLVFLQVWAVSQRRWTFHATLALVLHNDCVTILRVYDWVNMYYLSS